MTTRILIANIGQRDLSLDYEGLAQVQAALCAKLQDAADGAAKRPKPNLRKWGALLLDHMDKVLPFLSAPILDVALRDLDAREALPERVLLAGTKQDNKEFQKGDTFRCAEALIPVLKRDYPGLPCIETYFITGSPNDLNAVLPEYATLCRSLAAEQVSALCTGGTPACNMALSLRTIEFFGESGTVMHVAENAAAPTRLHIGQYLLSRHRHAALERLAARGDFDAIAEDEGYARPVRTLARAAAARMNFNFKECRNMLLAVKEDQLHDVLAPLLEEAGQLAAGTDRGVALAEVYWNALLKWRRDECADFLGRVWRLLEGSLQDIISLAVGHTAGAPKFREAFETWTAAQPEAYRAYVAGKRTRRKNIQVPASLPSSVPVLILTVDYFVKHDARLLARAGFNAVRAAQFQKAVNLLRPLTDLRNGSVMAHGFSGIWKNKILTTIGASGDESLLLDRLCELMTSQNITLGLDPYARFAKAVITLNQENTYDAP